SRTAAVVTLVGPNRRIARTTFSCDDFKKMPACTTFTITYPTPNAMPASPNASGTESAQTRNAPIPAISSNRRVVSVGGTAFVSTAYPPYIHHRFPKIRTACATPRTVGSWTSSDVSCVIVKTKTRSKNSSMVETRISSAGRSAPLMGSHGMDVEERANWAASARLPRTSAGRHTLPRGARPRSDLIVIYRLTAAVMWGTAAVTATYAVRKAGTFITLVVGQGVGIVILLVMFAVRHPSFADVNGGDFLALIGTGLIGLVGYLTFYKAL